MKKTSAIILFCLFISTEMFSQNGLTAYAVPSGNGATYRYRNDLKVDAADNVWVAFKDIGMGKFNGSAWTVYNNTNSSFPDSTAYAIAFDNMNNVWAGTNKGLAKFDGTTWNVFNTTNSSLPDDTIISLATNGTDLWIGTKYGAVLFDGTFWTNFNTANSGIICDTVNAFAFGTNGELWIGTYNGLSKFYQSSWTNYNSSNSGLAFQNVISLVVDNNNELWIGSLISRLYKMEGGIIKNYATEIYNGTVGFGNYTSSSLTKNLQGNIVMSGSTGLCEITPQIVNKVLYLRNIVSLPGYGFKNAFNSTGKLWIAGGRVSPGTVYPDSIYLFDNSQHGNYGLALTNDNFKYLDINSVKAAMMDFGMMHWDIDSGISRYEVPKGTGKTSVFCSSLWIGGLDASGNLHAAAQTYRQTFNGGGNDFWPGPIDTLTGVADSASIRPYDKIWKVNRFDVEDFKYNFLLGNVTSGTYQVPLDMLTWPASGTGNLSRNLAPYVDYNNDGMYNPFDGDYPKIKGDQMLYWIFNDNFSYHQETDTLPLGFEIHASAYSYTCPNIADSNSVLNTTTFYNYRIINRSNNNYDSLFIGLFADTDLGYYKDDYVGCDTVSNAAFDYNGDNFDDLPDGYALNPPMQNVQILQGPLADIGDGIDNDHDGTIDEPGERCMMNHFFEYNNSADPIMGNPQSGLDYYYYLSSRWRTGIHLTYGGNGYNSGSTNYTNYMLSGTPYDTVGWSETMLANPLDDRRIVVSSGPFSLAVGQETTIDFAYVFTWDSTAANGLTTSIARNIADLQRIKHWFDTDSFPSCLLLNVGTNQIEEGNNLLTIQPNPAHDRLIVSGYRFEVGEKIKLNIFDLIGREIGLKPETRNLQPETTIDVLQLTEGLYVLELSVGEKIYRKKFVKQ
jgi:hypothetical protein